MAQASFTTKLTKELRRSPKKTAVLALMGVVALWFWAPLVWKWVAPKSSKAATASAATAAAGTTPTASPGSAPATPSPAVPAMNWQELAEVLQNEPLLATARIHEHVPDPFALPVVETKQASSDEDREQPTAETITQTKPTPEQLGLILASTITGGRRAVATINGKACGIGDVIVVPAGGSDFEFTVVQIAPEAVTLASDGQTHVLATRRQESAMQLSQAGLTAMTTQPLGGQRIVIGAQLGE